jgi:hypothetical protein
MKHDILKQYTKLRTSLEQERAEIKTRLSEIEAALGTEAVQDAEDLVPFPEVEAGPIRRGPGRPKGSKRKMSPANKVKLIAGIKARWAKYRAEKAGKVVENDTVPAQLKPVSRFGNAISLPKAVVQVTSEHPMTKQEILEAVQKIGYRFHTKEPLKSLNPILYGDKPKFIRIDGKFSSANVLAPKAVEAGKAKRKMSAAGKARIIAGTKARWAKFRAEKAGKAKGTVVARTEAPKLKGQMSPAGRAAIVAAQKARWAKVKAAKKVAPTPATKSIGEVPVKPKRKMSAAGRKAIAAAAKARWAKKKADQIPF